MASHIALEEAGAKFEAVRLDLRQGDQNKPEFLAINPKHKVPTLVLDDGKVLTENPAIISYVADTHPAAKLLAPVGDFARAHAQEWLAWCASAVHISFGPLFVAMSKGGADETQRAAVQANLDRFDGWLAGKKFILGEQFSGADCYTLVFYNWARLFKLNVGENIKTSVRALIERPGVQRMLHTQSVKVEV
jgi:glutathione S-transferase